MLDATVKKLWNGCISLRENWIKLGIANGGLRVELRIKGKVKGEMRIPPSTLERSLLSKPTSVISKIDGKPYNLYDVRWTPINDTNLELFGRLKG